MPFGDSVALQQRSLGKRSHAQRLALFVKLRVYAASDDELGIDHGLS
jgi:hypothetical protein